MLISRRCLEAVGLLEETYFLCYEELDLAARARPAFLLGYSPESVVYHKEGGSIAARMSAPIAALSPTFIRRETVLSLAPDTIPGFFPPF
jgi:GT2 family glycosyltransferase